MHLRLLAAVSGCLVLAPAAALAAPCSGFADVDSANTAYCSAVTFIKNRGVTAGCTDASHYCPNDYVTRLQMALFMRRLAKGGPDNTLTDETSGIGGGNQNSVPVTDAYAFIGGGYGNIASGYESVVAGGFGNTASGTSSAIPGGSYNVASQNATFAAGRHAVADQPECAIFNLWSNNNDMGCLGWGNVMRIGGDHGFSVDYYNQRVDGGGDRWVGIGDQIAGQTISTWTGAYLTNGGAWTNSSDRNAKTDIAAVDAQSVLDKVAAMPVSTWRYRNENGERHLGPMAQDFHAAFGLGSDDRHIATVDADGVAFAAIKGLNDKLERENAELRARLEAIERRLGN